MDRPAISRNATPSTDQARGTPRAPGPLSDAQRLTLVQSLDLPVQGITGKVRLTPRVPYTDNAFLDGDGHFHFAGTPEHPEGLIGLRSGSETFFADFAHVRVKFRAIHPGRPVLVDFVATTSRETMPIHLVGSGILEKRMLKKGEQHITAVIVPKVSGFYDLALFAEGPGHLFVYAIELTVLE